MRHIKNRTILDFTARLSLLMDSGLSVSEAIGMIGAGRKEREIEELTHWLNEGLKRGRSFSSLINSSLSPFPQIYKGLISIGEEAGTLKQILSALTAYMERQNKIRDRIINGSIYPILVLSFTLVGMVLLSLLLLPGLEEVFADLLQSEGELFRIRRKIRIFSATVIATTLFAVLLLLLMITGKRHDKIRIFLEILFLKIPVISNIIIYKNIYSLAFALEILTSRGIPLLVSIKESSSVCTSILFCKALDGIYLDLISGHTTPSSFNKQKIFPERFIRWLEIGESTGRTRQVFGQLRIYYESELENLTTRVTGILEPALILIVGIIIIYIILTFIAPLFSLFGTVIK
ncbi:MAG: type II secretion system F family protein [Spirochaetales bacterium]|nr:type II secretion system F family protein [Spirochaetales bacterium]